MPDRVIDDQGRPEPPPVAGEADTLLGFLDFLRATVAWKTDGLSDAQLRATLPPSAISLGGLLKHLAYVEDYWFMETVAHLGPSAPFDEADWDADPDWDWTSAASDSGTELRALWEEGVARSRVVVAELFAEDGEEALDRVITRPGSDEQLTVRWILTHMIEEYGRHAGHADLVRESIDGLVGE